MGQFMCKYRAIGRKCEGGGDDGGRAPGRWVNSWCDGGRVRQLERLAGQGEEIGAAGSAVAPIEYTFWALMCHIWAYSPRSLPQQTRIKPIIIAVKPNQLLLTS